MNFNHPEAFCLMRYQSDDGTIVEHLWNSRDGVTPFLIRSKDGKTELHHTMRHMEKRPLHRPQTGDRIFVDMTAEKAREYALNQARFDPEGWAKRYPTDEDKAWAIDELTKSIFRDGRAPDIVTVGEARPFQVPLDDETRWILGQPCFAVHSYANWLRQQGVEIKSKAEAEQAAVIHWMLNLYLAHGPKWREEGRRLLDESLKATADGEGVKS